jgi:hypothetical protein
MQSFPDVWCHFLVHFLLWVLVTVREAVEHHFAQKQQIIYGHSKAGS